MVTCNQDDLKSSSDDASLLHQSYFLRELDPIHLWHVVVCHYHVEVVLPLRQHFQGMFAIEGLLDVVNIEVSQHGIEGEQVECFIVNNQEFE